MVETWVSVMGKRVSGLTGLNMTCWGYVYSMFLILYVYKFLLDKSFVKYGD